MQLPCVIYTESTKCNPLALTPHSSQCELTCEFVMESPRFSLNININKHKDDLCFQFSLTDVTQFRIKISIVEIDKNYRDIYTTRLGRNSNSSLEQSQKNGIPEMGRDETFQISRGTGNDNFIPVLTLFLSEYIVILAPILRPISHSARLYTLFTQWKK